MTRKPTPIAVAVVEHEGRFLVGQRAAGATLAGYWEFPGGKLRQGETPAVAACRECLEETGLEVRIEKKLACVEHCYEHGELELHFFAAVLKRTTESVNPQPAAPFRWVDVTDLPRYTFPEANRQLIDLLTRQARPSGGD